MTDIKEYVCGLRECLEKLDICEGDILYVSSDITLAMFNAINKCGVSGKAGNNEYLNALVDVLQSIVGETGTLLFPVFSWDFCRGKGFDYKKTKGEVGAWSNWVMKNRPDFARTQHPMYSFMVWGKYSDLLVNMSNQDGWGDASPFYFFREYHAKQILFDIEAYQGLTFCHYVEQCVGVPYRHPKYFFGKYIDAQGRCETRMYSMCVRDLDVQEEVGVTNGFLIEKNVAKREEWDGNRITVVDLEAAYPVLVEDMKLNNGANTLKFTGYKLDWNISQTVPYEIGKIPE